MNGEVQVDVIEETILDEIDKILIGTGANLVTVKLTNEGQTGSPLFGFKVKFSLKDISKACLQCLYNHKSETNCVKKKQQDYMFQLKAENLSTTKSINDRSNSDSSLYDWIEDIHDCSSGLAQDSAAVGTTGEAEGSNVENFNEDVDKNEDKDETNKVK